MADLWRSMQRDAPMASQGVPDASVGPKLAKANIRRRRANAKAKEDRFLEELAREQREQIATAEVKVQQANTWARQLRLHRTYQLTTKECVPPLAAFVPRAHACVSLVLFSHVSVSLQGGFCVGR